MTAPRLRLFAADFFERPVRLRFYENALQCDGATTTTPFVCGRWHVIDLECDCEQQRFAVVVDGVTVQAAVPFAEPAPVLERIVFRTGPWRGLVPAELVDGTLARREEIGNDDLGVDGPSEPTLFWVSGVAAEGKGA